MVSDSYEGSHILALFQPGVRSYLHQHRTQELEFEGVQFSLSGGNRGPWRRRDIQAVR